MAGIQIPVGIKNASFKGGLELARIAGAVERTQGGGAKAHPPVK